MKYEDIQIRNNEALPFNRCDLELICFFSRLLGPFDFQLVPLKLPETSVAIDIDAVQTRVHQFRVERKPTAEMCSYVSLKSLTYYN